MRDHAQLVHDLLERGLEVERGRHLKVRDGGKLVAVVGNHAAHGRGDRNAVAALRRAGLIGRPESAPSHPKQGKRPERPTAGYDGPARPFGRAPRSEVLGGR